jgi:transposase
MGTMQKTKLRTRRIFSEDLRKQIVQEYESGQFTVNELAKLHATYRRTIYRWIYRYSIYNQKNIKVVESNQSSDKKIKELYARIKELEAALGRSKLESEFNAKIIEIAKDELGIDLKKNYGTKSSGTSSLDQESRNYTTSSF